MPYLPVRGCGDRPERCATVFPFPERLAAPIALAVFVVPNEKYGADA